MTFTYEQALGSVLTGLLAAAKAEVESVNGELCDSYVTTGADADGITCTECGSGTCGTLWVRLVDVFASSVFPEPHEGPGGCQLPMAATVAVGVSRCAPLDTSELTEAALATVADSAAIRRALCCLPREVAPLRYVAMGPQGGCHGGEWVAVVSL